MKRCQTGFTLLELIVALAVAATVLAGVAKVIGSSAFNTQRMQDKTFAQWVAMNLIAEIRATRGFPPIGKESGDMEMAGRKWYWRRVTRAAPLPISDIGNTLREVVIDVYPNDERDSASLITLTTFIVKQQ